ncbi:MAG: hypothetical protein QQN41_04090 [Nitrosopumilus sp.]
MVERIELTIPTRITTGRTCKFYINLKSNRKERTMSSSHLVIARKECSSCCHLCLYDENHVYGFHCYHPSRPQNPAVKIKKGQDTSKCSLCPLLKSDRHIQAKAM